MITGCQVCLDTDGILYTNNISPTDIRYLWLEHKGVKRH